jgi:hypothetical protein
MVLDMHPWTGLSDDVRLGVLTGSGWAQGCSRRCSPGPGADDADRDRDALLDRRPRGRVPHEEPDLAIAVAYRAARMLVIMDRGFSRGGAVEDVYAGRGAPADDPARSSVARRPVQVLDNRTYLARMNLE